MSELHQHELHDPIRGFQHREESGHHHNMGSQVPLALAGALVLFSLLSVAWLQWFAESAPEPVDPGTAVAERSLRFEDLEGGVVRVSDAETGALVRDVQPGELGFVRATLRGLARSRRARDIGAEAPFLLRQLDSGRLLLIDTATGQEVDLWAFGSLNAQPFTELLHEGAPDGRALAGEPAARNKTTGAEAPGPGTGPANGSQANEH